MTHRIILRQEWMTRCTRVDDSLFCTWNEYVCHRMYCDNCNWSKNWFNISMLTVLTHQTVLSSLRGLEYSFNVPQDQHKVCRWLGNAGQWLQCCDRHGSTQACSSCDTRTRLLSILPTRVQFTSYGWHEPESQYGPMLTFGIQSAAYCIPVFTSLPVWRLILASVMLIC